MTNTLALDLDRLEALAKAVPEHVQRNGWFVGKPQFGHQHVYADDFKGQGRQHIASLPAGKTYFGSMADFIAAANPATILALISQARASQTVATNKWQSAPTSAPDAADQQNGKAAAANTDDREGVAGLRPYEFMVQGQSLRWYLKRDVDALLATRTPAADAGGQDAAVAAIQFALEDEDGLDFLSYWNEGEFDVIRRNWENVPEAVFIGADPLHPATRAAATSAAVLDVMGERRRQVEKGYTPQTDDCYPNHTPLNDLARAAACYALAEGPDANGVVLDHLARGIWPWDERHWKPKSRRRNLVKACALLLAEIERMDRGAAKGAGVQGGAA